MDSKQAIKQAIKQTHMYTHKYRYTNQPTDNQAPSLPTYDLPTYRAYLPTCLSTDMRACIHTTIWYSSCSGC